GALEADRTAGDIDAEARTLLARGRVREGLGAWAASFEDHTRAVELARAAGNVRVEMLSLRELGGDVQVGRGGLTADCESPLRAALAMAEQLDDRRTHVSILSRLCVVTSNQLRFDVGVGL